MVNKNILFNILRWSALISLGAYVFLSALYGSSFAKLHVDIRALELPLFIGELIFFLNACIFLFLYRLQKSQISYKGWAIYAAYIILMLFFTHGTCFGFALRNAAMYYYAFVALFVFHALQGFKVNTGVLSIAALFLILECFWIVPDSYFRYSFIILCILIAINLPNRWVRIIVSISLLFTAHPTEVFAGPRTNMVASLFSILFIIFISVRLLPVKKYWQALIMLGCISLLGITAVLKADPNNVKSMITPGVVIQMFKEWDHRASQIDYNPQPLSIQLYHTNNIESEQQSSFPNTKDLTTDSFNRLFHLISYDEKTSPTLIKSNEMTEVPTTLIVPPERNLPHKRSIDEAYANILFRLFVWRDMLQELWQHKALFGFGFGHPQRSRSLEVLCWAASEWKRDGWITPHNLFLHLVYRSGIIGILFIFILLRLITKMCRTFIHARAYEGIFLISILVYWLVSSQILVVLELPYYAIPFWFFMGITWAFYNQIEKKQGFNENA